MAVRFKTTVQKEETVLTPETASSDSSASAEKTFTAEKIPAIVHLFKMADVDKSGGLDMDEFYGVMKEINPDILEEEACVLHMKIDTNCDRTVDLGELLHYLLQRNEQAEALDYKNLLFPYGFTYKDGDSWNKIVKMICRPTKNITAPDFRDYCPMEPVRSYKDYTYISITSNGKLKFWSNDLEVSDTFSLQDRGMVTLPFHNPPKMQVNDMIYISDLMLLAVSTTDREVLFYNCKEFADLTKIKYCIIEEDITAMEYYRAGNKGILAFGDSRGYLYVFVSYYVRINGLFCKRKLRSIRGKHYPIVTISSLLKKTSTDFNSLKMFVFDDICTQVQYLPSLHFFTVCGETSKSMALIECIFDQEKKMPDVNTQIFTSPEDHRYYRCVAYSHNSKYFLTGGLAGVLRVWFPHKTRSCERELHGHKETVSHIIYNPIEKLFLSMSTDKKICIWVDGEWICKQTIYPSDLPSTAPISSVCYNIHNNELYVANKNIAKCFGRGTNAFHETLKSHEHPLSSMIYHSIYKQVVSVCQKGIVTVWDILSGKAVMQFDISQNKYAGQTFISFDEVNRKLITVSQNRMVQQWNFNNGEMLDVLPEKIPNDVTSIVCINDEMFVSAKDCPDILQLDSKGQLKNVLNHFLLDDICSMDYHEDRLITASTNGNVLTWDLETLQVWDYIKTTDKPQVHRVEIYLRQQSFQQDFQPESTTRENEKESPLIVKCLRTRSVGPKRATLLITRDTHITAWSTTINGGLISRFKVVKDDDAEITCIFLSETETTLLTGDSNGVVCLYDIQDFGIQSKDDKMEFETVNGCKLPLQSPPLLASWQAAHSTLVSVACDPACEKVITGELQYNVKLWTNTGTLVGTFGKDRWVNMVQKHHIPPLETTNFGIPGLVRQELKKKKADLGPGNALKLMTDGNCFVSLLHLFECQPEKKVLIQALSEEPTPLEIIWNRTLKALNRIEQELKLVKKIKQNSAVRHISALEKLIAHWIEDEKENFELSTDEVLEQSESVETQHSVINVVETTESTEAEETSEKEDSSTCFGTSFNRCNNN
ncbi:WD repeat-containing protein on Y chromosome-like [Fundulus heteroclitus]|uniref:WD repeat-containing protein on Y chromosome-like n=1 Tax=Fundulus heteroclitus TaxID=8078 RepID=UPI00165B8C43|nr:WD repeat-containing protein on Y chromosome-like [Fundulus heteroclitus]